MTFTSYTFLNGYHAVYATFRILDDVTGFNVLRNAISHFVFRYLIVHFSLKSACLRLIVFTYFLHYLSCKFCFTRSACVLFFVSLTGGQLLGWLARAPEPHLLMKLLFSEFKSVCISYIRAMSECCWESGRGGVLQDCLSRRGLR